MPLFGKGNKAVGEGEDLASIRNVPRWEEAAEFLGNRFGIQYETTVLPSLLPRFPRHQVEVARDKDFYTMLIPGTEAAHADMRHMEYGRLEEMDAGATTEEIPKIPVGTPLVGRRTVVRRQYVDGFVECVNRIYQIPWDRVKTLTYKHEPFPMTLIADQLAFCIAPAYPKGDWKTDKYHPELVG